MIYYICLLFLTIKEELMYNTIRTGVKFEILVTVEISRMLNE